MADRAGQQLGHYRLIRLLGEGGFAEVYLGEHIHLGSQAAIKVLHSQLTSDDVDKFLLEARNLVRLIHPNIVRVLDFGIQEKTPFLVMDFAPNGTLRHLHPKGVALPLSTVVSYVKQIADGLQFAHDEKLIHRDIKPENMLIGRRNEILLSDFGIAIVAQSSRYQSTQDLAGTIAYMAPEQIQAHPRPASDQYSLGVVVYEWLTGDRPFHGGFSEIAIKHTVVPPPPLRERIPTISPDVEQVVLTALAKEPKDRFGSMQAFARALEQASLSDQSSPLAPTIIVKSPIITSQLPHLTLPSTAANGPSISSSLPVARTLDTSQPVGTTLSVLKGHLSGVNSIAWARDGQRIFSAGDDRSIRMWDIIDSKSLLALNGHTRRINSIACSPDGRRIVSASDDRTARVWDIVSGRLFFTYSRHGGYAVNAAGWSPDGQYIATAASDGTVQLWDANTGTHKLTYGGHLSTEDTKAAIWAVAWSPNGKYIVSGSNDNTARVWTVASGSKILAHRGHSSWVNTVAWSPEGSYIVSGSDDSTLQVWNAATGATIGTYHGHTRRIFSAIWSPDGRRIASASKDSTVQIWDATTGKHIFTYRGHTGEMKAVAWSPDGRLIASGSWDGTVHIWVAP